MCFQHALLARVLPVVIASYLNLLRGPDWGVTLLIMTSDV